MVGFDQRCPYHAYDLFTHTAQVCAATPGDLTLRWAGLLHDVGKIPCFTLDDEGRGHFYGHAQESARMADAILRRLKAPTALRENVVALIDLHMTKIEPTKKSVRRWLSRLGSDKMDLLINLQQADMGSKGTGNPKEAEQFPQIRAIIEEIQAENACLSLKDLAVNGSDLLALGFPAGKALGNCLNWLLGQILDETLENNRDILLDAARNYGIREGIL